MSLSFFLQEHVQQTIAAYEAQPDRILEDARAEEQWLSGGYGHRQIYELIQNGADAIKKSGDRGRVEVLLTDTCLYCANQGEPLTEPGLKAMLMAHFSDKKGDEIGRFGLGFKSVLGVCDHPEVFSKSVCFRFNPQEHAQRMRALVRTDTSLPRLRTAALLDTESAEEDDPLLAAMMAWATTVIRLPLKTEASARLLQDLESFPPEFLAFCPHVRQLALSAPVHALDRSFHVEAEDGKIAIADAETTTLWRVFERKIRVDELSPESRLDMDVRLRKRELLPLMWATPIGDFARRRGHLWAFFPTQTETTLQGILNAPWKTNSDRENLLDGEFNREMLRRSADLVACHVGELSTEADPARFLDALPARDDVGWADRTLTEALFAALRERACMPTAGGNHVVPETINLRPTAVGQDAIRPWLDRFGHYEPETLVHRSAHQRERAARAVRLGCEELTAAAWIKRLLTDTTPERSVAAVCLADVLMESGNLSGLDNQELAQTCFVLTRGDQLVAPQKDRLAFGDDDALQLGDHVFLVHQAVADNPDARRILQARFRIAAASMEGVFSAFLNNSGYLRNWSRFWELSRQLDVETASRLIRESRSFRDVQARTASGQYKQLFEVLLVGAILQEPFDKAVRDVAIDSDFHRDDLELLRALGATDSPTAASVNRGKIYKEHRKEVERRFLAECNRPEYSTPQVRYIKPVDSSGAAPLDPLESLNGDAGVRMTNALLPFARLALTWTVVHATRRGSYPEVTAPALIPWALKKYGWVPTSLGPRLATKAVGPGLRRWSTFLPVANSSEEDSEILGLEEDIAKLRDDQWQDSLTCAMQFEGEPQELTTFYAMAASQGIGPPDTVRCLCGATWTESTPKEIILTADHGEMQLLRSENVNLLYSRCREDINILVDKWRFRRAPPTEVGFVPHDEAVKVIDLFPGLVDQEETVASDCLQPCESLWLETRSSTGKSRRDVEVTYRDACLYYTGDRTSRWLLDQLADQVSLRLSDEDRERIAQGADAQALEVRLDRIRRQDTIEDKLIEAVGIAAIRSGIPERHLRWLEAQSEVSDQQSARLAHAVYGIEVLKAYRAALASNGLQPPSKWAGGPRAVGFVRDLGFPEEYAGFLGQGRAPWEDVLGPVELPELHDFQARMCSEMLAFLGERPPGRGILCLPTGAGKTRVAVQSIIEWAASRTNPVTVLWIAQRDELCEQAVESWLQAWRAIGPESQQLRINRLWGSTNERIRRPDDGASLVVATFQTLSARLGRRDLDWVLAPDVVVIDEAHGSIARSYTVILNRLGLEQRSTARPLIGLTATPFRGGQDERETFRLAFRYGYRRFDMAFSDAPDLYRRLQDMEVLAHADHAELEGEELVLNPEELSELERFSRLPASVEMRIGEIPARNDRILRHIRSQPGDWPILLFSASVEHAEDLAVRLNMDGISACSISGNTSTGRRRHAIAAFKKGEIRVLTNYGVLTTGFDAPSVRALYVTRPVYSPLLYQQMIGRGLRGPKNGGKDRCLIVNIEDNIRQYGHQLAFRRFDYLWSAGRKEI